MKELVKFDPETAKKRYDYAIEKGLSPAEAAFLRRRRHLLNGIEKAVEQTGECWIITDDKERSTKQIGRYYRGDGVIKYADIKELHEITTDLGPFVVDSKLLFEMINLYVAQK